MAEDKAVRVAETAEIRRISTMDAQPSERRSLLDANLTTDTTPSGWREPVIVPPTDPPTAPVVAQGGGDE